MARVRARCRTRRGSAAQGPARQGHVEEPREALRPAGRGQRGSRRAGCPGHRPQESPRAGRRVRAEAARDEASRHHAIVDGDPSRWWAPARNGVERRSGIERRHCVDGCPEGRRDDPEGNDCQAPGDEAASGDRLEASSGHGDEGPSGDRLEASRDDRSQDHARWFQPLDDPEALDDPDAQAATLFPDVGGKRRTSDGADRTHGLTPTAER
jgi:hypothetical protein